MSDFSDSDKHSKQFNLHKFSSNFNFKFVLIPNFSDQTTPKILKINLNKNTKSSLFLKNIDKNFLEK